MTKESHEFECRILVAFSTFFKRMTSNLWSNCDKGGWIDEMRSDLIYKLKEEVGELERELNKNKRNKKKIMSEAADVALIAFMIADNWGG